MSPKIAGPGLPEFVLRDVAHAKRMRDKAAKECALWGRRVDIRHKYLVKLKRWAKSGSTKPQPQPPTEYYE